MRYKLLLSLFLMGYIILSQSCSTTKFVPEGEYLLVDAKVKSDKKVIPTYEMETYIKQKPNFKTFTLFKLPLFIYNLSGQDTTKWVNRTLRNAGDAPILYDSTKVDQTVVDLKRMMSNKGYLNAEVEPITEFSKKKVKITYDIKTGDPYRINEYKIDVNDSIMSNPVINLSRIPGRQFAEPQKIELDTILSWGTLVSKNSIFDLDILDQERDRISTIFRRNGYYAFNKEYIGFDADTTIGSNKVDLDLSVYPFMMRMPNGEGMESPHRRYIVDDVTLYVDYNPLEDGDISQYNETKTYEKNGYKIKYGPRGEYIKPFMILNSCYIVPGTYYNESMTSLTYSALSQLKILKNVNISYTEFLENDSTKLRCIITCVPDRRQGISADVEGTNSGGYFGVGAGVGYLHRNAFRGSEQFNVRLRGAYEAITPDFTSFSKNYFEIGGEVSLTFPRFLFPFLKKDFRRRIHASTQLTSSYTYQRRPGFFTRTVLSTGVKYIWQNRRMSLNRHTFDLIDISYIHLPKNSLNQQFLAGLSDAARLYSFRDHFIMSTGYTFTRSNAILPNRRNAPIYSLRASIETAGNVLALAAAIANSKPDENGSKQVFGTNYAQYVKGSVDYSRTYKVDEKNAVAWRIGGGLAYPYGNNQQIPIQKRFFSGGANSVRGWAVRELGPGSYYFKPDPANIDKDNFYFHSGDIRLDASIEFRTKLFWLIELGAFVDAGNIWTIKEYEKQEEGTFRFDKFYKEIALSWGLGLRLDFEFVLIRLDGGFKVYDPSNDPNTKKWPVGQPFKFGKNSAWHIAVGYPF